MIYGWQRTTDTLVTVLMKAKSGRRPTWRSSVDCRAFRTWSGHRRAGGHQPRGAGSARLAGGAGGGSLRPRGLRSGGAGGMATAVREAVRDEELGAFPEGAAFIDGALVPIAEAKIPILDWGFLRSDCTYDVVHVWNGRFFRLDHHLDRFEQSAAGLRLVNPYARDEMVAILMRLMRATGLREAYVEVILTRGLPPKGTRDPRRVREPLLRLRDPVRLDRERGDPRARHPPARQRRAAHPAAVGRPGDQELPLGRSDQGPVRILRAGLRHAGAARSGRQRRRGAGLQRLRGRGRPGHHARRHRACSASPARPRSICWPSRTSRR